MSLRTTDPRVMMPRYDRSAVTPGILHFGVGAFHRAHQAMFVDDVLAAGATDWGIIGVGTLRSDATIRDVLTAQDGCYTLLTVDPDGTEQVRVIGSILECLLAPEDPAAVLGWLTDPRIRIVSLTITEGGYGINDATGAFEPQDAATLADLATLAHPDVVPTSALGLIVAGLRERWRAGVAPFTVMSCDNIQENGAVARAALCAVAERVDPALAAWIAETVSFPNSMVDRITPATTDAVRERVSAYGLSDGWPVRSESFVQWVLEDSFSAGRPDFEQVGVQVVTAVEPYEKMKLRLLNASHQAMSYLGLLAGYRYVHEVCRDPDFQGFLLGYMRDEARPTLDAVPGIDLDDYCAELLRRFGSEAIADTLARQVVDASERIPKFLLPVVLDRLRVGASAPRSALVIAAWRAFLAEPADSEVGAMAVDARLAPLRAAAQHDSDGSFLDQTDVFGDLGQNSPFRSAYIAATLILTERGARRALG